MSNFSSKFLVSFLILSCLVLFVPVFLFAQALLNPDYTWTGGGDGISWNDPANWGESAADRYPHRSTDIAYIAGNSASPISVNVLNDLDIKALILGLSDTTHFPSFSPVVLNTNGKTVTTEYIYLASKDGSSSANDSNTTISGGGKVIATTGFVFPDSHAHSFTVDAGSVLEIRSGFYGSSTTGSLIFNGNGTLHLPASGARLDLGPCRITYTTFSGSILPYGKPADYYYSITKSADNNFPTGNVNFTATFVSSSTVLQNYIYTATIINNDSTTAESYKLNGHPVADGVKETSNISALTGSLNFDLDCLSADIDSGDGIRIVFRTPDDSMVLCVYEFIKGKFSWNGSVNSEWTNINNWNNIPAGVSLNDLSAYDIEINSGVVNFPNISSDVKLKKLIIASNSYVTQSGGILTLGNGSDGGITCSGNGGFKSSGGTAKFRNGTGFSLQIPTEGKFYNLETESAGSVNFENDIYIAGDYSDNGNSTFAGNVIFNGNSVQHFKPNITKTYASVINKKNSGALHFDDSVKITNYQDTAGNVDEIFTSSATFSNAVNFTTLGNITIGNVLTSPGCVFKQKIITSAGAKIRGNVTFSGGSTYSKQILQNSSGTTFVIEGTVNITGFFSQQGDLSVTSDILNSKEYEIKGTAISAGNFTNAAGSKLYLSNPYNLVLQKNADFQNITENIGGKLTFNVGNTQTFTTNSTAFYSHIYIEKSGTNVLTILNTLKVGIFDVKEGKVRTSSDVSISEDSKIYTSGNLTCDGTLVAEKNLTNLGSFTANQNVIVNGNFLTSNVFVFASNKVFTVKKNVSDDSSGSSTWNGKLIFNGTIEQVFSPNQASSYTEIEVEKTSGNFFVKNSMLTAVKFFIKKCTVSTFEENVSIADFKDTLQAGSIVFKGNSVFSNLAGTEFLTSGHLILGDELTDTFSFANGSSFADFTHRAGDSSIKGVLNTGKIFLEKTDFEGTINATSVEISTVNGFDFSIKGNSTISTSTGIGSQIYNGKICATGEILLTGKDIFINKAFGQYIPPSSPALTPAALTVTNSGKLTILDITSSADMENIDVFCKKFVQNGTGLVEIAGDIKTQSGAGGDIIFSGPCSLTGNIKIESGDKITFNSTASIDSDTTQNRKLTLTSLGDMTLSSHIGSVKEPGDVNITCGRVLQIKAPITSTGHIFSNCNGTIGYTDIQNAAVLTAGLNENISLNGTYPQSDIQIAGSLISSGSGKITSNKNVFLYKNGSTDSSSIVLGGGNAGSYGIELTGGSLYSFAFGKNVTFNSSVKVSENIQLLGGTFTLGNDCTEITAEGDLVLMKGETAGASSIYKDSESGVEDLFSYKNSGRTSSTVGNVSGNTNAAQGVMKTDLPSGVVVGTLFSATFVSGTLNGKKLSCNTGNFYANGIDFNATADWDLDIADTDSSLNAFAEMYNCTVDYCKSSFDVAAGENCVVGGNCSKVWNTQPILTQVYTIYDDTIHVKFLDGKSGINPKPELKIENSNNEITKAVSAIKLTDGTVAFDGAYVDSECTDSTDGKGDICEFYLRVSNQTKRWNTDATGSSKGDDGSANGHSASTDRGRPSERPTHRNNIPNISMPKALPIAQSGIGEVLYATLRDKNKNRIRHYYSSTPGAAGRDNVNDGGTAGKRYAKVEDRCSPVLVGAYTGQELHYFDLLSPDNLPHFDSHNFIEFVYSEAVSIGTLTASAQNIRVTSALGEISNGIGANPNGITVAGLASIENGNISCGSVAADGTSFSEDDSTIHALYRKFATKSSDARGSDMLPPSSPASTAAFYDQSHRVRISIAGFVDGNVLVNGKNHNYWPGFIDSGINPSGLVSPIANAQIKDISGNTNVLDTSSAHLTHPVWDVRIEKTLSTSTLYGDWDLSPPVFANYLGHADWNIDILSSLMTEIIGTDHSNNTKVDNMEIHFFDNTPLFLPSDEYKWVSKLGWRQSGTLVDPAQDVVGGSRGFIRTDVSNSSRTSGGIRVSSLLNSIKGFSFKSLTSELYPEEKRFDSSVISQTVTSLGFFQNRATPSTAPEFDSLYLNLSLKAHDKPLHSIREDFAITYTSFSSSSVFGGFITDLAGNRMKSKVVEAIDRSAPKFLVTVAPVGKKELLICFNKQIRTTDSDLATLPSQLEIVNFSGMVIPVSENSIDELKPARVLRNTRRGTVVAVYLKEDVTFNNIMQWRLRVKKPNTPEMDPILGALAYIPKIYDAIFDSNYMEYHHMHPFSDFGVNIINPIYAFDNKDLIFSKGTLGDEQWVLRDFSGKGENLGKIYAGKDITLAIQAPCVKNEPAINQVITMHLDVNPKKYSVSTNYNENTGSNLRLWFPTLITQFAPEQNSKAKELKCPNDPSNPSLRMFKIPNSPENPDSYNWGAKSEIQFLFSIDGYRIDTNMDGVMDTNDSPLYVLHLADENDLGSLDLWSFELSDFKTQRGGVTIFNNVLNANTGEQTVIEVEMPQDGNLTIQVLTMDGDVVTNLHQGRASKGKHFYRWNGANRGGHPVSRGIYFVRVIGPNIDETRKVMCIKE
ncbi:MAG: hypothetical protein ACTTHG_05125 [Treponemataceae bacterium]